MTTPKRHVLKPKPCHVAMLQAEHSLEQRWKKKVAAASSYADIQTKIKARDSGKLLNRDFRQGENRKNAICYICFTLLRRITRLKM